MSTRVQTHRMAGCAIATLACVSARDAPQASAQSVPPGIELVREATGYPDDEHTWGRISVESLQDLAEANTLILPITVTEASNWTWVRGVGSSVTLLPSQFDSWEVAVYSDPFEVDTFGPYNGTIASGDAVVTHEELFGESRAPGVLENYLVTWHVSLDATLQPGTYYATFFAVGTSGWEFQETDINLGNDWYFQEKGAGVFQINQFDTNTFAIDIGMTPIACAGDANGDLVVDFTDLNIVLAQFGQTGAGLDGDLNNDDVVDFTDLNTLLTAFGTSCL